MQKKRQIYLNIAKAILLRLIIITHIIFLYLAFFWNTDRILCSIWMLVGTILICIECIYTIWTRFGQDFKWVSPMMLIYIISAYLPCFVIYHINDYDKHISTCDESHSLVKNYYETPDSSVHVLQMPSAQAQNLEVFFILVLLNRWLSPKGKITLEELSKLLLIYMSVIADILDMMKMIRTISYSTCEPELKELFFKLSLIVLSISTLQLCLTLTATRTKPTRELDVNQLNAKFKSKLRVRFKLRTNSSLQQQTSEKEGGTENNNNKNNNNNNNNSKGYHRFLFDFCFLPLNKCYYGFARKTRKIFNKEIWGICVSLAIKDIPFSIVRTYALVAPPNDCTIWSHSLFFQLKNYLSIIFQLNRCYILYRINGDNNNNNNDVTNFSQDSPTQPSILSKKSIKSLSSSLSPNSSAFCILQRQNLTSNSTSLTSASGVTYLENLDRIENFNDNLDRTSKRANSPTAQIDVSKSNGWFFWPISKCSNRIKSDVRTEGIDSNL